MQHQVFRTTIDEDGTAQTEIFNTYMSAEDVCRYMPRRLINHDGTAHNPNVIFTFTTSTGAPLADPRPPVYRNGDLTLFDPITLEPNFDLVRAK